MGFWGFGATDNGDENTTQPECPNGRITNPICNAGGVYSVRGAAPIAHEHDVFVFKNCSYVSST